LEIETEWCIHQYDARASKPDVRLRRYDNATNPAGSLVVIVVSPVLVILNNVYVNVKVLFSLGG
jgi:hypothetical protein